MPPSYRLTSILVRLLPAAALSAGLALSGCSVQSGGGITREQGDKIIAELGEIKKELAAQKAKDGDSGQGSNVSIDDSTRQVLGNPDAPLTLVEFTDYQCPFCKRFHDRSWPELKKNYVDTGKVRYIVRDMPLSFHANALPAAIAARCAGEQGQFWKVHEVLFNAQDTLSAAMARSTALASGIVAAQFDKCNADPATLKAVEADVAEANRIGVTGTPGFVLAKKHGAKLDGVLILGAQPTNVFSSRIDEMLAEVPVKGL
jgi:protein-disulfide isomerase